MPRLVEGRIVNSKYKVIAHINQGGTADIYEAINIITGQSVALKVMKTLSENQISSAVERFEIEIEILSKFNNENIVKYFDSFLIDERPSMAIELLSGLELNQIIKKKHNLSTKQTAIIAIKIVTALMDIHSKKIVHRDISPSNIMITFDREVKLIDFGIVLSSSNQDLTTQGNILGSVNYMSPEVCAAKKATPESDIYSLGATLFKALTGITIFSGDNVSIMKKQMNEEAPEVIDINPEILPAMNNLISQMLSKKPHERPTLNSILETLQHIVSGTKPIVQSVETKKH
ncbi:MAG: hypothetical protein DRP42_03985 [Tenericutes bacterium]|nr:MAG: hypothetical protein DRP42_03985 [Mycoplasmatota bacterium]